MQGPRDEKFERQARQYDFPYHYIPFVDDEGVGSRVRSLPWGLEYLCYLQFVSGLVNAWKPQSLLEVGCGDGRFINGQTQIPRRVGVDLEARAIALAQAMAGEGAEFRCCAADALEERFDAVVAIEVLEHVPDAEVAGFVRSLVDRTLIGGRLVVTVPTTVVPLNPKHHRHYDETLLEAHFACERDRIDDVELHRVYREPRWLRVYLRATRNRLWTFEARGLQRFVWRAVVEKCMQADRQSGRHLVLVGTRTG